MKKIGLLLILMTMACSSMASPNAAKFVVFIDAGSTGTRLHLYKYQTTTLVPDIIEIPIITANDAKSDPTPGHGKPLTAFANNPQKVADNLLKDLLDDAKTTLQKNPDYDAKNKVQIYLLGTAGMRLLQDQSSAAAIYKTAKDFVSNKYKDVFCVVDKIPNTGKTTLIDNFANLDGRIEALFGWLDVNYLLGNFQIDPQTGYRKSPTTVGSIDFGGASLEMALETPAALSADEGESFKIGGQQYYVFIKSFAGLGTIKGRETILADNRSRYCFPAGDHKTIDGNVITGSFDFDGCKEVYTKLLQDHAEDFNYFPSLKDKNFVAFSGVYHLFKFMSVDSNPGKNGDIVAATLGTQQQFVNHVDIICKNTSAEGHKAGWLKKRWGYCANAVFFDKFVYEKLPLEGKQITVTNTINGNQIEWTFGAVLNLLIQY